MFFLTLLVGFVGVGVLAYRLGLLSPPQREVRPLPDQQWPTLSVIVPARDEAHNLPRLLTSLKNNQYPKLQILVVDDASTDNTAQVAADHGATVIDNPALSGNWRGKSWACHNGAQQATGDYLLFVDADTEFYPNGLFHLVNYSLFKKLDLLCPLLYHRCDNWWEKLFGPFHMMYLLATAAHQAPRAERMYANGQCLLFKRDHYENFGHNRVQSELAEDLALASLCLQNDKAYGVYSQSKIYNVNMYSSFADFFKGWKRILRLGLDKGTAGATLEVIAVVIALLGCGQWYFHLFAGLPALLAAGIVYSQQKKYGNFSTLGAVFAPLSVIVFTLITLASVADQARRQPIIWKGRAYQK